MEIKTKGIVLTAPQPYKNEVATVAEFIERVLAPAGVNLVVLQVRYRYQFKKHPECQGFDPLSYDDVKLLLNTCRRNGIRLIPKMNLLGHQFFVFNDDQTDQTCVVYRRKDGAYGLIVPE